MLADYEDDFADEKDPHGEAIFQLRRQFREYTSPLIGQRIPEEEETPNAIVGQSRASVMRWIDLYNPHGPIKGRRAAKKKAKKRAKKRAKKKANPRSSKSETARLNAAVKGAL